MKPSEPLPLPAASRIAPVRAGDVGCRVSPYSSRPVPGRPAALMSFAAFCRAADALPALSALLLEGGAEPLLHPRIFDMVRYASARGIEVSLRTRLAPFSARRAEECVASGLARLLVDVAAGEARTMRNVELVLAARAAARSAAPRIELLRGGAQRAEACHLGEGAVPVGDEAREREAL